MEMVEGRDEDGERLTGKEFDRERKWKRRERELYCVYMYIRPMMYMYIVRTCIYTYMCMYIVHVCYV